MPIKFQRFPIKSKSKTRASHENILLLIKSRLKLFTNIDLLDIEVKSQLKFSILNHHKLLTQIHINDQVEPTKLENIGIAKQLQKINRGDFTFGKLLEIFDFQNLLLCPNMKMLYFINANYPENVFSQRLK